MGRALGGVGGVGRVVGRLGLLGGRGGGRSLVRIVVSCCADSDDDDDGMRWGMGRGDVLPHAFAREKMDCSICFSVSLSMMYVYRQVRM